jgi:hypothetical protein
MIRAFCRINCQTFATTDNRRGLAMKVMDNIAKVLDWTTGYPPFILVKRMCNCVAT